VCIEAVQDVDVQERWQQYWRDNGEQLVWNDWLRKYPAYNDCYFDDSHCSASELVGRETVPSTCVSTGCVGNESEVSASISCVVKGKSTMFVNGGTCSLNEADLQCSQSVDCENHVEVDELKVGGRTHAVDVTNDCIDSLSAGVVNRGCASDISREITNDVSSDQVITSDSVDLSDGADDRSSWERHYAERYWYYYEWFMQWLDEEGDTLLSYSATDDMADDAWGSAEQTCHSQDDILPSLPGTCVAISQESVNVVESLLSELLLAVVESVSRACPADGNGQKQKRKKEKQHKCGLFGSFHSPFSDLTSALCSMIAANVCDVVYLHLT